jgi:hypothetical protein
MLPARIGARTLSDLQGCAPFELLQYKDCGWRTVGEIKQLVERAISGEFDVSEIEEHTAGEHLFSENGIAPTSESRRLKFLDEIVDSIARRSDRKEFLHLNF